MHKKIIQALIISSLSGVGVASGAQCELVNKDPTVNCVAFKVYVKDHPGGNNSLTTVATAPAGTLVHLGASASASGTTVDDRNHVQNPDNPGRIQISVTLSSVTNVPQVYQDTNVYQCFEYTLPLPSYLRVELNSNEEITVLR